MADQLYVKIDSPLDDIVMLDYNFRDNHDHKRKQTASDYADALLYSMIYTKKVRPLHTLVTEGGTIDHRFENGQTMLHFAARLGRELNIIDICWEDMQVDIVNVFNKTPLFYAILGQHDSAVECLLRYGADPMAKTNWGLDNNNAIELAKSLIIATEEKSFKIVQLLKDVVDGKIEVTPVWKYKEDYKNKNMGKLPIEDSDDDN